jgi:sec-independent protein translocase protein TatA
MSSLFLIGGFGGQEILLIALVVLLLFGGRKIPELMKGLGKGIREFNNAKANIETEIKDNIKELDTKEPTKVKEKLER